MDATKKLERITAKRLKIEIAIKEIREEARCTHALSAEMLDAMEAVALDKEAQGEDTETLRKKLNELRQKHAELSESFESHVSSEKNAEAVQLSGSSDHITH